jgi:ATP-dependent Clp protease, protease subunit
MRKIQFQSVLNKPQGQLCFRGIVHSDRSVKLPGSVPLNARSVAQIQRAMIMQGIAKGTDLSSLKLYIGPTEADTYRDQDAAALADTMILVKRPVDVIIQSGTSPDALKAIVSATGKVYMLPGASLGMGPVVSKMPYGKNKALQVRRNLFNDYYMDLETLIMRKTGITDRAKVHRDLNTCTQLNAMQALAYGLIDGILIDYDKVITRLDLETFHQKKGWKAEDIEDFNKQYMNVYKLPQRPLRDFSPSSVPGSRYSHYQSLEPPSTKGKKTPSPKNYFIAEKGFDKLPLNLQARKEKLDRRILLKELPLAAKGILEDDVIYFNDAFTDETAEQISAALLALFDKKIEQRNTSHIKILENSPGGSVWAGQALRSTIKSMASKIKVDVIVEGMGASCGSWLLCSATGNRFATPNARVMIHEAALGISENVPANTLNNIMDHLDQMTMDYIGIVSDATGREFKEVLTDFNNDTWFNPLEAIMYGPKGLVDGILVGADKVITRQNVENYLQKKLGSPEKIQAYLDRKIEEKRDPRLAMEWRPEKHNDDDPFDNPLKVIQEIATTSATLLSQLPRFKDSAPPAKQHRNIDFFNVVLEEKK